MTEVAWRRPPFDPEIQAALESQRSEVVTALASDEVPELRERSVVPSDALLSQNGRLAVTRLVVPGAAGAPDVPAVLVRPRTAPDERTPVLFHLHGGGLVTGTMYDDLVPAVSLAADLGCAVLSVDYRLAPEHPYPAALEDAYGALVWMVEEAGDLGLDADRVVIGGVSAGGGLAAAATLLSRESGGPAVIGQMLVCPMLDDRNDTTSAVQMAGVGAWDRQANQTAWSAYLGDRVGTPGVPSYAAPARATDLADLPPTFIDVGSAETFRDECVAFAGALWAAGSQAELHVWPGGCHGFEFLVPDAAISRAARAARTRWLRRTLAASAGARRRG
ncbi:alpha/beta hydrolase [Cellulomonas alba]|uniref:Alpha/beta hydrolase n=1 Tax=Cellulomonas alba TaxID=3053467 RepID=A0ABT7SI16_9CELL|nr:alpha/beta hydrolase [Cellulomonas alba]MDM7855830.1 alpha/beta hydrolase [Cellulomonas alba]